MDVNIAVKEIEGFILAGGHPNWLEWISWTVEMKKKAIEMRIFMDRQSMLDKKIDSAVTLEEALIYAEEISIFDGGERAKNIRMAINQEALRNGTSAGTQTA